MNKISSYRKALGYTQANMASVFGISVQAYYRKERGYVPFTDTEKVIIVNLFRTMFPELTVEELFFSSKYKEIQRKLEVD